MGDVRNLAAVRRGRTDRGHVPLHSTQRWTGSSAKIVAPLPDLVEHTRTCCGSRSRTVWPTWRLRQSRRQEEVYMETNGRFWAYTEGSVHAGRDSLLGLSVFSPRRKTGSGRNQNRSTTCWHYGDLMALMKYLRGRGESPTTGTTRLTRAVCQYLSDFSPRIHSDVFHWSDPMPGIMEHMELASISWSFENKLAHRSSQPMRPAGWLRRARKPQRLPRSDFHSSLRESRRSCSTSIISLACMPAAARFEIQSTIVDGTEVSAAAASLQGQTVDDHFRFAQTHKTRATNTEKISRRPKV